MPSPQTLHKAAFLGPKGENVSELERLLLEVLHDHVFWRRNFHPSDRRLIAEKDKQSEEYGEMVARLRDELFQILAELKRGAPLYSPRQIAHMVSDPTMPALVGYFAGMLYNQNNVVAEASPETVRKERAYFVALAEMIGYPPFLPETLSPDAREARTPYSWGHLCSGGTSANLEALWVARNVRLFPPAVRLLAKTHPAFAHLNDWPLRRANGTQQPLGALSTSELSNVPISEITDLHLRLQAWLKEAGRDQAAAFEDALPSVRKVGLTTLMQRYNDLFSDDPLRPPRILISQAAHYCWDKGLDVVGLGAHALIPIPVDARIRIDVDALADQIHACDERGEPVLAVVSICGTTEEGAVDPLHEIEHLRKDVAEQGITFWHHSDAAFGGYFASMLPKDNTGAFRSLDVLDDDQRAHFEEETLISEAVFRALKALPATDSVTIDPHKFGYIPYPAGAVLFQDYHVRDAISYAAPYLATDETAGFSGFLGQWTLEGSRPGAAAVSCYLSQEAVPLTEDGHGQLMKNCIAVNKALVAALTERFADDAAWIKLRPLATPDTVGFCFALIPQNGLGGITQLNDFTRHIWHRMTVDGREDINQYGFLLSKTEVNVAAYRHVLTSVLDPSMVESAAHAGDALTLLRSIVMNPFLKDWDEEEPTFAHQFADYLYDIVLEVYRTMS